MPDLNTLSTQDRNFVRTGLALLAKAENDAAKKAEVVDDANVVRKFEGNAAYITDTLMKEFDPQHEMLGGTSVNEAHAGIANTLYEFFQKRGAEVSQELCDKLAIHVLAYAQRIDQLAYIEGRQDRQRTQSARLIHCMTALDLGHPDEAPELVEA